MIGARILSSKHVRSFLPSSAKNRSGTFCRETQTRRVHTLYFIDGLFNIASHHRSLHTWERSVLAAASHAPSTPSDLFSARTSVASLLARQPRAYKTVSKLATSNTFFPAAQNPHHDSHRSVLRATWPWTRKSP